MAKVVNFYADAPGLKPNAQPHDGYFDVTAQLMHLDLGKGRVIQVVRLRASGGLLLYERVFRGRDKFVSWLRAEWSVLGARGCDSLSEELLSMKPVNIPVCY